MGTSIGTHVDVEAVVRSWVGGIDKENGSSRGWNESQIRQIVDFAKMRRSEFQTNVTGEEIYEKYVNYQIELAEAETND